MINCKSAKSELKLKAEAYLKAKQDARQIDGGSYGKDLYWMRFELGGSSEEDLALAKELVDLLHYDYDYDDVDVYTSKETGNYYIYATWRDRDYLRI